MASAAEWKAGIRAHRKEARRCTRGRMRSAAPVCSSRDVKVQGQAQEEGAVVEKREELKKRILELSDRLDRGVKAMDDDIAEVDGVARQLEAMNPTEEPVKSEKINGKWRLRYTTSTSILGTKRPPFLRPFGAIFQSIDNGTLRAKNEEGVPLFNSVTAELTPRSGSYVDVQFLQFKILGLIPVTAPATAQGALDITYLDDDMRIARGDKGNLFILTMEDRSRRLPV